MRAEDPADLSVTVYRAPYRSSGSIDLDRLEGFALISETRAVQLPAGMSRLRFEGVADGIEPASAIVTGLDEVIEKNRDAALLSPSALMAAAVGKSVVLLRTNPKTGKLERLPGTILSDADGGVVFQTAQGIEALRCSGLAESFSFSAAAGLAAVPTLSVQVRSPRPATRMVMLSYLARGFDWAANYTATLSADGKTMDLGAWVTLANGNGVGFPAARTQVVAGRVNRESGDVQPIDVGGPILARCWPRGSTSDPVAYLQIARAVALGRRAAQSRHADGGHGGAEPGHGCGAPGGAGTARRLEALPRPRSHHRGEPPVEAGAPVGSIGDSGHPGVWRGRAGAGDDHRRLRRSKCCGP